MAYNDGLAHVISNTGTSSIIKSNKSFAFVSGVKEERTIHLWSSSPEKDMLFRRMLNIPYTETFKKKLFPPLETRCPTINAKVQNPINGLPITAIVSEGTQEIKNLNNRVGQLSVYVSDNNAGKNKWDLKLNTAAINAYAVDIDDFNLIMEPAITFVEETNQSTNNFMAKISPITVNVEDYKPPSFSVEGSGGGLKTIRLTAQINAFIELNLHFDDSRVRDVIGLPNGLSFDGKVLKGTPILAGTYPLSFKLDNNRSVEGMIVIPPLQRRL